MHQNQGKKATDTEKMPSASAKKLEENEKKKKLSGSGVRPLAVLQSAMEKEKTGICEQQRDNAVARAAAELKEINEKRAAAESKQLNKAKERRKGMLLVCF